MPNTSNPDDQAVKDLFARARTIAVVGLSPNESKDSYRVASYLKSRGYRIIPVNPTVREILGEPSYADLRCIPDAVDVVDVFRRSEYVPEIAEQAAAIGAKALWLQLGITHEQAARIAAQAGLLVVQDACMLVEHKRLSQDGAIDLKPLKGKR
ncbi:MAG: CoA-binding protein [Pseudomonadota bacterium]|jgi:uncharacterized protein